MPPSGSELHFSGAVPLEVAEHGGHHKVIRRVIVIYDCFGQYILPVEPVEKSGHFLGLCPVAHRISARVRTEGFEQTGGVVPQWAEVNLHGPIIGRVPTAKIKHNKCPKLFFLELGGILTFEGLFEYSPRFALAGEIGKKVGKTMIGQSRSEFMKLLQPVGQRFKKSVKTGNFLS